MLEGANYFSSNNFSIFCLPVPDFCLLASGFGLAFFGSSPHSVV